MPSAAELIGDKSPIRLRGAALTPDDRRHCKQRRIRDKGRNNPICRTLLQSQIGDTNHAKDGENGSCLRA